MVNTLKTKEQPATELEVSEAGRKQAEAALRESEEKFSKAFRCSPDIVSITTLKDGIFLEVNDSFTRLTGYTREEVIGRSSRELDIWAKPEERDRILKILRKQGRAVNEEYSARVKSGEIRTMLFSAEPTNIGGKPHLIAMVTDITERKRAEEALRQSEEKYKTIFENVSDVIVRLNKYGNIIDVNKRAEDIFGYKREELIGKNFTKLGVIGIKELPKMVKLFSEAARGKVIPLIEVEAKRKDGGTVLLEVDTRLVKKDGKIEGTVAIIRDITERKQVELTLRESEEKYRNVVETSKDSIVIVDPKGNIQFANQASVQLTGYSLDEGIGMNLRDMIPLKYWPRSLMKLREAQKGKAVPYFETAIRRKDGTIVPVEAGGQAILKEGKIAGVQIITRDITERKQAEEALRESEEKFSKAFHSSPDIIVITTLKYGIFTEVNDTFIHVTGYTREEVTGRRSSEIGIWAKLEERDRMLQILEEKGRVSNEEFHFRMKSGEIRTWLFSSEPINIGGEPCVITVQNDITELKRAEEALANEAIRRRILIEQSIDGIVVLDENSKVYEANQRFAEMLGYSPEEVRELHTWDWDTQWTREELLEMGRNVDAAGYHLETYHRRKDGTTIDVEISVNGAVCAGQKLIFCVCRDITERKRAEEKLKQALSNLEHSSTQLAATNKELEAFSYSVSHDLRAPLRSIDGFSQALLEDYQDKLDEQGQNYLSRLRAASQKMGELIDGLLKLSRLTRSDMHKEKVDLSALAEEITTRLQETQPKRQAEFVISRGLTASGDRQLLRALLENLLGNAWKFTGKRQPARIEFGTTQNGDKKAYFIRDNGAGFDMTYADKLFGAFQRLHETTEFPGTGIGLATVQRIIHRHGGSVWAEGAVGEGATFYFTLS